MPYDYPTICNLGLLRCEIWVTLGHGEISEGENDSNGQFSNHKAGV